MISIQFKCLRKIFDLCLGSPRFAEFVRNNEAKIQKKLKTAKTAEDEADVVAELEVACLFLRETQLELIYEPSAKGPDFRIVLADEACFAEIKRVRRSPLNSMTQDFEEAVRTIIEKELGEDVRTSCTFTDEKRIHRVLTRMHNDSRFAVKVDQVRDRFLGRVLLKAKSAASWEGDKLAVRLPGAGSIVIERGLGISVRGIGRSGKESFKYTDLICKTLGQLQAGHANVLTIKVSSESHISHDVHEAMHAIVNAAGSGDDEFFRNRGFQDAADFCEQIRRLSSLCIIGWRHTELIHIGTAEVPLPDCLHPVFKGLTRLS